MQPNECALLLAIPTDRREFDADLASSSDFLRSYRAQRPEWDDARLWDGYAPLARLASEIAAEMASLGVCVTRRVTAAEFGEAAARCAVVTLVAHSLGPDVRATDVLDPSAVLRSAPAIEEGLEFTLDRPIAPPRTAARETIACWLNALIDCHLPALDFSPGAANIRRLSHLVQSYTIRWRRRRTIERIVPGSLAGGVGVEFADGFQSIESVDDLLPERLSGTLDFTVCESVLLGQTLRARRAGGVILSNADLTSADFRLALYRQTVTFMLRRRIPYAQAALTLRSHLKGTLCCH